MAWLGAGPAGSPGQLPPVVEADLAELVQRVRGMAEARPRPILGLAGAPGSGKSTIAEALAAALADMGAVVVPFDGFHLANSTLAAQGKAHRKGALDTFDTAGYAALLKRLRALGPTVYAPSYQRNLEEAIAGSITVEPACRLIITEGNYLLVDHPDMRDARSTLTQVWYIDLDDQTRLDRLVGRHVRHGKSADDARDWALGTDQVNAELVAGSRGAADLCIRLK
jgi:pantothenate kinase